MPTETDILNPTIFFGDFEFREPVTTLTDFMVAIVATIGVLYLNKNKSRTTQPFFYYRSYFFFFAIGMTSAAWLGHGLQAYVTQEWKIIGWLCILTAQLFLALASLKQVGPFLPTSNYWIIKISSFVIFFVFVTLLLFPQTRSFKIPQTGNALMLIGLTLPLQLFSYYKEKNIGSLYILLAIIVSGLTAVIYNSQFSFSRWFNYHDISHIMVSITIIIMIRSTKKLALNQLYLKIFSK